MADINQTFEVLLKEYPSQLKMLQKAEYIAPYTIRGEFLVDPTWSYKSDEKKEKPTSPVSHFTLAEAVFSHNQMTYVLIGYLAQIGKLNRIPPLTLDEMNEKKFNKMVLTDFSSNFKKPFISGEPYSGTLTLKKHRVIKTSNGATFFAENEFDFMEGSSYGSSRGIMMPEDGKIK